MKSACMSREKAWCPLCTTSRTLNNQTSCYICSELWKGGQSLFCCCRAEFQGVSQWLSDGVNLCVDVSVGQFTRHNLLRTRVRFFSSMLWLFLAFGTLALSCAPLSGSSLRSSQKYLFFWYGKKDKVAQNVICQPTSAGGLLRTLHVVWIRRFCQSSWSYTLFFNCSVRSSLVMTHSLFLLTQLIAPQKGIWSVAVFLLLMFGVYWVAIVPFQIHFLSLVLRLLWIAYLSSWRIRVCVPRRFLAVGKFRPLFSGLYWSTTWSQVHICLSTVMWLNFPGCLPLALFLQLIVFARLLICLLSSLVVSVVLLWRLLVICFLSVLWLGVFWLGFSLC